MLAFAWLKWDPHIDASDIAVAVKDGVVTYPRVGSPVIAGSINLDGPLLIQCSGAGTETAKLGSAPCLPSITSKLLSRHPHRVSPSKPQRARPPANATHSSTKARASHPGVNTDPSDVIPPLKPARAV